MSLKTHLQYARYVAIHKMHVGVACAKEGLYLRGLLHDWHKLLPSEWRAYMEYFYGKRSDLERACFDLAWLRHQHRADHHWQWWLLREDEGELKPLYMALDARMEMICDWYGAGQAMGKGGWEHTLCWYTENKDKMVLHPNTRAWVEKELAERAGKELARTGVLVKLLRRLRK